MFMDANEAHPTSPIMFATPLEGASLFPLLDYPTDHKGTDSAPFVSGKIIGIVPTVAWRYESGLCRLLPTTKWWALVCKSTDEQVTEANLRASAHSVRIGELLDDNMKLAKTEKELRSKLAAVTSSAEARAKELGAAVEQRNEKTRALMKIEEDLAKVKKHFGEKAFADALATGK